MRRILLFSLMLVLAVQGPSIAEETLGLTVGDQAPDFQATTYEGEPLTLSKIYAQGPVVLIFYRGGWCPYCNRQLQGLQERYDEFTASGAQIVAVSVDLQAKLAETVETEGLAFPVVSDSQAEILNQYNIVYHLPDDLVAKYKNEYGIDVEGDSGETHHIIAVPAAFIIDQTGSVVFAYVNEDYKVRVSPDVLLDTLNGLDKDEQAE